jgi:hypothetical protein
VLLAAEKLVEDALNDQFPAAAFDAEISVVPSPS